MRNLATIKSVKEMENEQKVKKEIALTLVEQCKRNGLTAYDLKDVAELALRLIHL